MAESRAHGLQQLHATARAAVTRWTGGDLGHAARMTDLFDEDERQALTEGVAALLATAELLGRARVRLRVRPADPSAFAEAFCGGKGGKPGPCPTGRAERPGAQARKKAARIARATPPAAPRTEEARQGVVGRIVAKGAALKAAGADLATRLGTAAWDKLSPGMQAKATAVWSAGKYLEHKLTGPANAFYAKSKALALEVATQRGKSVAQVARVAAVLAVGDAVARWTVNIPAVHHALHLTGVGGTVGFLAAKVGYYVPVASLAYLATSTARNPFATIRAARAVFSAVSAATGHAEFADQHEVIAALFDGLTQGGDWFAALVHAALDATEGDLPRAVDMAAKELAVNPAPPANDDSGDPGELLGEGSMPAYAEAFAETPFPRRVVGAPDWSVFGETVQARSPAEALAWFAEQVPGLDATDANAFAARPYQRAALLVARLSEQLADRVRGVFVTALAEGHPRDNARALLPTALAAAGLAADEASHFAENGARLAGERLLEPALHASFRDGADAERRAPDLAEEFPTWVWEGILDDVTRPAHAERIGKYYPSSVTFDEVRGDEPGDYFNCRCDPVELSADEWADLQADGARIEEGYSEFAEAFCGGKGGKPGPCPEHQPVATKPTRPLLPERPTAGFQSDAAIVAHAAKMVEAHEARPEVRSLRQEKQDWLDRADKARQEAYMLPADQNQAYLDKVKEFEGHANNARLVNDKLSWEARHSFAKSFGVPKEGQPEFKGEPEHARVGKTIVANFDNASRFAKEVSSKDAVGDQQVKLGPTKDGRACYENPYGVGTIRTNRYDGPEISVHELGHHLEEKKDIRERVQAFSRDRFGNEPFKDMAEVAPFNGYKKGEESGRQDDLKKVFGSQDKAYYAGKTYPGGRSEVLSMGLEQLYRDPVHFARADPQYFALVTGCLQRKS